MVHKKVLGEFDRSTHNRLFNSWYRHFESLLLNYFNLILYLTSDGTIIMQISDNDSISQHSLFVTHEFHTALVKNGTWNLNVVRKSTQISRILSIFKLD